MPRYRAKERGFDNVKVREPEEVFDFDGKLHWAEVVKPEKAKDEKPEPKEKGEKPARE